MVQLPMRVLTAGELEPFFLNASLVDFPPRPNLEPRIIGNWQLVCCLEGRGVFHLAGWRHEVSPGRAMLYGPGDVHGVAALPGEAMRTAFANFFWNPILVPPGGRRHAVASAPGKLDRRFLAPRARPAFLRSIPILLDLSASDRAMALLREIAGAFPFHERLRPLHLKALTFAFFEELRRAASGERVVGPTPALRLRDWLERNFRRGVPRAVAARELGVSESTLSNLARRELGVSFSRAVRKTRLAQARALLELGDMSVGEAARSVGYDDPLHFSRLFKAEYGVPPSRAVHPVFGPSRAET